MSESGSPFLDKEIQRMRASMDSSGVCLALVNNTWLNDPTAWAQIGYMLLQGKPLYLMVKRGTVIPPGLKRAAESIEEWESMEDIKLITTKLLKKYTETIKDG